jgi:hypothetical protein
VEAFLDEAATRERGRDTESESGLGDYSISLVCSLDLLVTLGNSKISNRHERI